MTLHWYIVGSVLFTGVIALIPIAYTLAPIYPWAYSNSRVRTMRKHIITEEDIKGYLNRPYGDIVYDLEDRFIPQFSRYLSADFTYAAVDNALRKHLIHTVEKLVRITPDQSNAFLRAYQTRFEIRTLKNVIRYVGTVRNKGDLLIPHTSLFSDRFTENLAPTYDDVVAELKHTKYYDILEDHKDDIQACNYVEFEAALNRLYLRKLRRTASTRYSKGYVKRKIDRLNISTWLRGTNEFLSGGLVTEQSLHTDNFETFKKHYADQGHTVADATREDIEDHVKADVKKYGENLFAKDPHSEASTIGFLIQQVYIIEKLNILLKLKYHDTEPDIITEALAL